MIYAPRLSMAAGHRARNAAGKANRGRPRIDSLSASTGRAARRIDDAIQSIGSDRGVRSNQGLWRMRPMEFITRFFTWWTGETFGTQVWTALYGEFVGEDEYGNRFYRTKGGRIDPALGFERRWVTYKGLAEASTIGPAWHGWIHHTFDTPPTMDKVKPRPWWKPHRPKLTGTPAAYRPTGSTLAQNRRPRGTGDYKPWTPAR